MKNTSTKIVLLFCFALIFLNDINAQPGSGYSYSFSASNTALIYPTGGSVNIILPGNKRDEFDTLITPAGFHFSFGGSTYTKAIVSSNGWLALAPASTASLPPYFASPLPNNSLTTYSGNLPMIAPLWDDDSCNVMQYNLVANVLWVRWIVKWAKDNTATPASIFMVSLDGNTGAITFSYTSTAYTPSPLASASIGIAGPCAGQFYSVTPNNTIQLSTIDSLVEDSIVVLRVPDTKFVFTPITFNENCSSARNLGILTTTCTNTKATMMNATNSIGIGGNCSTSDVKDVWFTFNKPAGSTGIKITTSPGDCNSVTGTSISLYNSCSGSSLSCATSGIAFPTFGELTLAATCPAATYFVRVTSDGDIPGSFNVCVQSTGLIILDDGNACTIDNCDILGNVNHTPLIIDDNNACTVDACDTINGAITHTQTSFLELGNDTTLPPGSTIILNAGPGFSSYFWIPNGQTTDTIIVNQSGTYYVTVNDSTGCTLSDSITVTIINGISDINDNRIFIYPNPGNGHIFIRNNSNKKYQVRVYDMMGQLIYLNNESVTEIKLDVSDGTYLLDLIFEDQITRKKITVN